MWSAHSSGTHAVSPVERPEMTEGERCRIEIWAGKEIQEKSV